MRIPQKLAELEWCGAELRLLQEELDRVIGAGNAAAEPLQDTGKRRQTAGGGAAAANPQIPTEPGGWWHQYVCPEHHTELLFDPLEQDAHSYRCPYGCELEGAAYRGAWLVYRHQAWARYALQAAVVYAGTGEVAYAELGRQIIVRYARQFPHYPVHPEAQPWMLKGRAFHQALTEAIWATTLLRGYGLLVDEGVTFDEDRAALDTFLTMLESSLLEYHRVLVHDRREPENNYTAWLIAALAAIYAAKGERDQLAALIAGEGGFQHHLDLAIRSDGLEFEGSVYYHVFVLRAYFITAEMAERCGIALWDATGVKGHSLQSMCDVLVLLADGSGRLAALHDGPYDRVPYAREIAEVLEIGIARYGNWDYEPLLAEAYRQLAGQPLRSGLEAVLYGTGSRKLRMEMPAPASGLLPDSGWARLAHPDNPLSCLVDYGPHGGSHGHYDKLNLMMEHRCYPIAPDRGTVPYGSPLKKGWYPHSACHNTVTVGGRSQSEAAGRCRKLEISEDSTYAWLETNEAYAGSRLSRHVVVTAGWVLDWFEVELAAEDQLDWWFHYTGEAQEDGDTGAGPLGRLATWQTRTEPLGTEDGYTCIRPVSALRADGAVISLRIAAAQDEAGRTDRSGVCGGTGSDPAVMTKQETMGAGSEEYVTPTGRHVNDQGASHEAQGTSHEAVHLQLLPPAGTEVVRVQSPGLATDPSREMEGVLMRCRGTAARFIAVYSAGEAAPHVQWAADGPGKLIVEYRGERRTYQMTEAGLQEGVE